VNDLDNKTGAQSVLSRSYLASLPERTARAGAALTGGLVYETGEVLLPLAIRRSKLYQVVVGRLLRITIELVGGVEGVYPTEELRARELLVRKTAGNVIELGSFLAVGWSPVWLLAGASDLIGGTNVYLRVLATELRDAGVLSAEVDVASFEELLTALEGTSGHLRCASRHRRRASVERRQRAHLVARTAAAGSGFAGRRGSREDLLRPTAGRTARGSLDTGDFFHSCARRGACGCEARKCSHLRLLSQRAANHRRRGSALLPTANQHPLPDAGAFALRSSVWHLLGTSATALGRSPFARGAPNEAADPSIGRGKCRPSLMPKAPPPT
jgi:hypothetical protein